MLAQTFRYVCNRSIRNHCHISNAFKPTHASNVPFIRYFSQDLSSMSGEDTSSDQGLEAMSLLQYGEKQVYLFGIQYDDRTPPNMKSMINDFGPDHIIFGLCGDRRKKLQEIMDEHKSQKSEFLSPLSCGVFIRADPFNSTKHQWKIANAKQVIQLWGLWYGKEYYDTLLRAEQGNIECVFADKPMQGIVDELEQFMNMIEDTTNIRESRKEKLIKKSENMQVFATGRQKANKAVVTKAQNKARAECAKLDKDAVVTLDNVCDMFMDKEFMAEKFPDLFDSMYEQRDQQMFDSVKKSKGNVIFCVLPQIHVEGVTQKLLEDEAMVLM